MFTIGTDPEFFMHDTNKFRSAIGRVPGTKTDPHPTDFGNIHADNVALELNIRPADCMSGFISNLASAMGYATELAESMDLAIVKDSFAEFDEEELTDPLAKFAGCDPDWNAYSLTVNNPPCLYSTNARSAGGHIHIGMDIAMSDIPRLVKALDMLVTLPMLKHDHPDRRKLYGRAGSFRVKPYGLEYRTPSNFWAFSKDTASETYARVKDAVGSFKRIVVTSDVERAINSHDLELAAQIGGY